MPSTGYQQTHWNALLSDNFPNIKIRGRLQSGYCLAIWHGETDMDEAQAKCDYISWLLECVGFKLKLGCYVN